MNHVWYRIKQGWRQLTVLRRDDVLQQAQAVLSSAAFSQFQRLSPADQLHAVNVYRSLVSSGFNTPDLAQAALLHDVGKAGAKITLFHRTAVVLLRRFAPLTLQRLSSSQTSWRRPFFILVHHSQIGASLARACGCSTRTMWLIEHHDLRPPVRTAMIEDSELQALQAADDTC
ncbi:MAG: hypothetical protein ACYC6L_13935 [Anaerolineae bacterium]